MKNHSFPILIFFIILGLTFACESDPNVQPGNPVPFPDFSNCNCPTTSGDIVCTSDGQWFRNECFATCLGVNNLADTLTSCPDTIVNPLDTLTWPIQFVCHPVLPAPPSVASLGDGTDIFQVNDTTFIRGILITTCRCLPAETTISTPNGPVPVSVLRVGDEILTQTLAGEVEIQPIMQVNKVPVRPDHKILKIGLEDGRVLRLTPEHPATNGEPLNKWQIGEELDGSKIIHREIAHFTGSETWDILPAGETGIYQAGGIWIGSTLKQQVPVYTAPIVD